MVSQFMNKSFQHAKSDGIQYDFRKIQFGYTDAQTEGQECPNLMTDGYVDIEDVVSKALVFCNI